MSVMKAKERNALPNSKFALPAERKYPISDRAHAANAKARATQQAAKGNITPAQKATIDRKANHVLHEAGAPMPDHMKHAAGSRSMKG